MDLMTAGRTVTCHAAVAWSSGSPLIIEQIEVEPPRAGEVRIRMLYASLCQTDLHMINGSQPDAMFPLVVGHEGAGVVESVGAGVEHVAVGDHVIPLYAPQCGECEFCLSSRTNICLKISDTAEQGLMPDGTTRFSCRGEKLYHCMGTSTLSEYTVVAGVSVCRINSAAPLDRVCLLGCGVATGYGAVLNTCQVESGSTVGVWGLSVAGLAAVMGAKEAGAKRILVVDADETKFPLARQLGATICVNPTKGDLASGEGLAGFLAEEFGSGLDYTFDCVGDIEPMRQAIESAKPGWGVACVVGVKPSAEEFPLHPFVLLAGRTLKGSYFGGWKGRDAVPELVERFMEGRIELRPFITHKFKLDSVNKAVELLREGSKEKRWGA